MTDTYRAPLGAILALTTGRMVCTLDEMYGLQDYLAGRSLMTHERTEPFERHQATLLTQFPRLAEAEFPPVPEAIVGDREALQAHCNAWVAEVAAHVGWTEADVVRDPETGDVDPEAALDRLFGGGS